MSISELIAALNRRAKVSDEGYEAKVKLCLHAMEFNGSGYYIETEIADVSSVYGDEKDEVLIDTVLSAKDLKDLQRLKSELSVG